MNMPDGPLVNLATQLTRRIVELSRDPSETKAIIAGTFSSMVAAFDDDTWEQIMAAARMPCGVPDCDCEISTGQVFDGLDAGREHYKKVMKQ